MLAAIGTGRLRHTRGGWLGGPVDPSPCWCGAAACFDHADRCARCLYLRARANLRRVRINAAQSLLQCRDACEGRDALQ
jgi:hypothetical protein